MQFFLNDDQIVKLEKWKKEVYTKGVKLQKKEVKKRKIKNNLSLYEESWELGYPYTGAIGGQFSYTFTPNSIGESVKVKDAVTGEVLDLTDISSW